MHKSNELFPVRKPAARNKVRKHYGINNFEGVQKIRDLKV